MLKVAFSQLSNHYLEWESKKYYMGRNEALDDRQMQRKLLLKHFGPESVFRLMYWGINWNLSKREEM